MIVLYEREDFFTSETREPVHSWRAWLPQCRTGHILLTNDRGEKNPRDRISIEVQHEDNYSLFKVLQNEVKLCNFSSRYLMTVDMSDFDRAVAEYSTKMDIAKKMLEQGKLSVTEISAVTGLPEAKIRDLK